MKASVATKGGLSPPRSSESTESIESIEGEESISGKVNLWNLP